jgi:hypothetical protein
VLRVDGKVVTLHNTLVLYDPAGTEVARVQRKLLALRPTYEVTAAGRQLAEVRKHLFTPFVDRFSIESLIVGTSDPLGSSVRLFARNDGLTYVNGSNPATPRPCSRCACITQIRQ